jgi:hypothetical protein
MKLTFPHYEGDSIIRQFIEPLGRPVVKVAKPVVVVQRNITPVDADGVIYSGLELEMQVRAMRREYLREWIKGVFGNKND